MVAAVSTGVGGDIELLRGSAAVMLFPAVFLFPPSFSWYLMAPTALAALAVHGVQARGRR